MLSKLKLLFTSELKIDKVSIAAALSHQSIVPPAFHDAAILNNIDFIRVADRIKSVRND